VLLLRFSTISVIRLTSELRVELAASFVVNLVKVLLFFVVSRRSLSSESLVHVSTASVFVSHGMEYGQVIFGENFAR
jgi:hypothetical protein